MSNVIALQAVSKRYGAKEVLHGVELDVGAGDCLALIGHNGAGKTTLLKLLLGLTRPSGGTVRVEGQDPVSARSVAARTSCRNLIRPMKSRFFIQALSTATISPWQPAWLPWPYTIRRLSQG